MNGRSSPVLARGGETIEQERRLLPLAHRVDPGIDREGRYRRVTGPPCETRKTAAHET
jgi:hypothetical protein